MKNFFPVLTVVSALAIAACEVDVEDDGELPNVDVDVSADSGKLPEVEVRGPDVKFGKKDVEVEVPDVDVTTEKKTVTVPTVDVELPPEEDPNDKPNE